MYSVSEFGSIIAEQRRADAYIVYLPEQVEADLFILQRMDGNTRLGKITEALQFQFSSQFPATNAWPYCRQ